MINLLSKKVTHIASALLILLLGAPGLAAQNRAISGTVRDAEGQPVIGAAVVVAGQQSLGVMTDTDGKYAFSVPAGATIEVSCIGYVSQTAKVGSKSTYDFILAEDSQLLEETVVIGYGVQKKSDLTGSVASVKSTDLMNRSTTDAAAALQGKAAGVQILNNSGAPGSGAQIRVRGYSSNSGSIGPLLIVDGLKVDNIQYLDPSMIANMEILKDAASAAIYGAEAGNGVVLITTKSGAAQNGTANISYSASFTNQRLGKKAELFDAFEYIDYQKAIGNVTDELLVANKWDGQNHDWFDAVFAPSWAQQHAVTFSGGNNKGHFFSSLNYVKNDGIVKGDKDVYKRLSAQINADYNLFKWFTVGTNTSIEKWETKSVSGSSYGSMLNSVMSLDPLTPAYYSRIEDCTPGMQQHYADGDIILRDPNHNNDFYATSRWLDEATGNPLLQRDRTDSYGGGLNVRGSLFANVTPFKGLVYTSRLGYRIAQSSSHSYSTPYWATPMANAVEYNISANVNTSYYYQWENFVNYNQTFGQHSIGAMAGMSYIENNYDNASMSSSGKDILQHYLPQYQYISYLKKDAVKNMSNAPGRSASIAYFGRLSYSYADRYSLQANFRADAFDSSKLSAQNRWGYFPSVSAGWTISNESFVKDNVDRSILSFLKIRGSWGVNGNISVLNGYPYTATISVNGQWYQYNPSTGTGELSYGSGPTELANPDLKWETSEQIDLGLDARMFNSRLTLGFDWYRKVTRDLLISIAPVPEIGVKSTYVNAGNVLNTGVELELGWKDSIGDFTYSVNANMATLHNEVLSLHKAVPRIENMVSGLNNQVRSAFEAGYPIWYFRGYKYAGVDSETGAPLYYNADGKVVDSVSDNDRQFIGKAIPDATYGITINLGYKGFDFSVFGTGTIGNDIFSMLYSADRPKTNSLTHFWRNSWKTPGGDAKYPESVKVANDWIFWSSSASVFSGSYFKFKQIQLGYTLPRNLTRKVMINDLRLYVSLDDFFTISSYPGCDPETATTGNSGTMGYDLGTYPTMKKVIMGVNLTF